MAPRILAPFAVARRRSPWLALLLLAALAASACAEGAGSGDERDTRADADTGGSDGDTGVDPGDAPGDAPDNAPGDADTGEADTGEGDVLDVSDTDGSDTGADTTDATDTADTTDTGDMTSDVPCSHDEDCAGGQRCVVESGGAQLCRPPQGDGVTGTACTAPSDCATGLCVEGLCSELCVGRSDCPGTLDCVPADVTLEDGSTVAVDVCVPPQVACDADGDCPTGQHCTVSRAGSTALLVCGTWSGGGVGATCGSDADCASTLCLDGVCSAPCERPIDCSSDGSSICAATPIELGSGATVSLNVCVPAPPDSCAANSQCTVGEHCVASFPGGGQVALTCGPAQGAGGLGASCASHAACASNLCVDGVCAVPCVAGGDCAQVADYRCELSPVPLPGGGSASASICVPPTSCTDEDDCAGADVCYVRRGTVSLALTCDDANPAASALGQVCTQDSDCAANLCVPTRFGSTCRLPCDDHGDCAASAGYTCTSATVTGTTGAAITASLCSPPPLQACTRSADCGLGEVCAVIENTTGTALESVCIPSGGGKATGVACGGNDECTSRVCLAGSCAALCDPASGGTNCGSAQICASDLVFTQNGVSGTFDLCQTLGDVPCTSTRSCSAANPSDTVRLCSDLRGSGTSVQPYCAFPVGSGGLGTACTSDAQCASGLCLDAITGECTVVCQLDSDCAALGGGVCSPYLVAQTSIAMCNRGCGADAQCPSGRTCQLNEDPAAATLDQVCQLPAGAADTGAACTSGADCQGGLCLSTSLFDGTPCLSDGTCSDSSRTCACLDPNATSCTVAEAGCAYDANVCTTVCRTGSAATDCASSFGGNLLTRCDAVTFSLSGGGSQSVDVCIQ